MNHISPCVYKPGISVSVDEMTMRFKGKHKDKLRITYKKEGDGFQADALCDDGFTLQVHMRNDPAPKKYLRQGLSPLHSRVMSLFDVLEEKHHQCAMDNLYNSASFCRAAYNHKQKVLCHGVARKGSRGVPSCVLQSEVLNRKDQMKVRGTVKAAVLQGDPGCPNLVATSVYDTKPVHYLSMISEEVKWIEKEKEVFNVDTNQVECVKFLRMGHIDVYNGTMGDVDWVRNRKWWWSMFFWGFGVLLTNAYVTYCKLCDEKKIAKKKPNKASGFSSRTGNGKE